MNQRWKWRRSLRAFVGGLVLTASINTASPAIAAERFGTQLGALEVSVSIADLEAFTQTGQVPPKLQPYRFLLTDEVRQALSSSANLNPSVSDRFISDLLKSTNGDRLINLLQRLIVGSTKEEIAVAISQAAQQLEGLSLLGILQAYPQAQLTIDLEVAIVLFAQINPPQQAIETALKQTLMVPTLPFRQPLDPAAPGTAEVHRQTFEFQDQKRDRTILTDLYWSDQQQGSLVVLSHGFGASRRFLSYLAEHLASHGFTVAAIEHPASNAEWLAQLTSSRWSDQQRSILPATEFVDRPKDIQFVLDELEQSKQQSAQFAHLNTKQVTVIGHSLGGYTALALAGAELNLDKLRSFCNRSNRISLTPADWLECTAADLPNNLPVLHDARIAQIIALNPVVGDLFTPESLAQIQVPTIVLSNSEDTLTPPIRHQLLPFHQMQAEKHLITAIGATHLSAGTPHTLNQELLNNKLVHERPSSETEPLRQMLKGISLAFVQQLTPESTTYRPFLSSAYAQSLSTDQLQLRFATELPPQLVRQLEQLEAIELAIAASPRLSSLLTRSIIQCGMSRTAERELLLVVFCGISPNTEKRARRKSDRTARPKITV